MPSIKEYTPQVNAAGPIQTRNATGEDFGGSIGGALENFGQQVIALNNHLEKALVTTKVTKKLSDAQLELQQYTDFLENGSVDEQGNRQGAPPVEDRPTLYDKKVQEINLRVKEESGAGIANVFETEFSPYAGKQRLGMMNRRLDTLNAEARTNLADSIDQNAILWAEAKDPFERPSYETSTMLAVDTAVRNGVLTPEQGRKYKDNFYRQTETSQIMLGIRTNTLQVIDDLQSIQNFPHLEPQERQAWLDKAYKALDRKKEPTQLEMRQYGEYRLRAARGEDITEEITQRFINGHMKKEWYDTLMGLTDQFTPVNRASKYLGNLMRPLETDGPQASQAKADALAYFDEWTKNHPNASYDEAKDIADQINDAARHKYMDGNVKANIKPIWLTAPDEALRQMTDEERDQAHYEAYKSLVKKYSEPNSGMSFDELKREARRIQRSKSAWASTPRPSATTPTPKPKAK